MTGSASKKFDLPAESKGYLRIPYSLAARSDGMTGAELTHLALVFSRSRIKADAGAVCSASYADFMQQTGVRSKSTVARSLRHLVAAGRIEQRKRFHDKAQYTVPGIAPNAPCIELETFLFDTEFEIPREGRTRRLRFFEKLILALIATQTKNPRAKGFTGSVKQIADMLGLCEKTVRMALDVLVSAKLVFCQGRYRGCRYTKSLCLHANKEIVRRMRHARHGEKPKTKRTKEEIAADERAERERFYAVRRQYAEGMAESFRAVLEADKRYLKLEHDRRAMDLKIARAEYEGCNSDAGELRRQKNELELQLAALMAELNISPPQLDPRTYYRCPRCSDTGFLPNGRPCDCYTPKEDNKEN